MPGPAQTVTAANELFPSDRLVPINLDTRGWDMPTTFTFSVMWDLVGSPEALLTPNADHSLMMLTDATDGIDTSVMGIDGRAGSRRSLLE